MTICYFICISATLSGHYIRSYFRDKRNIKTHLLIARPFIPLIEYNKVVLFQFVAILACDHVAITNYATICAFTVLMNAHVEVKGIIFNTIAFENATIINNKTIFFINLILFITVIF